MDAHLALHDLLCALDGEGGGITLSDLRVGMLCDAVRYARRTLAKQETGTLTERGNLVLAGEKFQDALTELRSQVGDEVTVRTASRLSGGSHTSREATVPVTLPHIVGYYVRQVSTNSLSCNRSNKTLNQPHRIVEGGAA